MTKYLEHWHWYLKKEVYVERQKPLPILVPPEDLKYAQVCKNIVKGHVVEVIQHVVFGDTDEILRLFGANFGGCIE
jgi:hypothetical protein